jgi:hypothetical protein
LFSALCFSSTDPSGRELREIKRKEKKKGGKAVARPGLFDPVPSCQTGRPAAAA